VCAHRKNSAIKSNIAHQNSAQILKRDNLKNNSLKKDFLIMGAGGHSKVVIDALIKMHPDYSSIRVLDDDVKKHGKRLLNILIESPDVFFSENSHSTWACIAIGDNKIRAQKYEFWKAAGAQFLSVIHPGSTISPFSNINLGSVIFAGAVINPDAKIGFNNIVNTGTIIEHDCVLEDHVQVATNATLCGGVVLKEGAMIGAGAVILPGVQIGRYAVIGAGAVVTDSVPDGAVYIGVPARDLALKKSKEFVS